MSVCVFDRFYPRSSDKTYFDLFNPLINDSSLEFYRLAYKEAGANEVGALSAEIQWAPLQEILALDAELLEWIHFEFWGGNVHIRITRGDAAPPGVANPLPGRWDTIKVNRLESDTKTCAAARRLTALLQRFLWTMSAARAHDTGLDVQSLAAMQADALARIEAAGAKFFIETTEFAAAAERRVADERERTRQAFDEKQKRADEAMTAREEKLTKERDALDFVEAKSKRKDIYDNIVKKLDDPKDGWLTKFDLTKETKDKRESVHEFAKWAIGITSGAALFQFVVGAIRVPTETTGVVYVLVRQSLLMGFLAALVIIYIRFLTDWFTKSAAEEFRNKRLLLDIHRANWFAELAFQWKKENNSTLPRPVLERMTRHLFDDPTDQDVGVTLRDALKARYMRMKFGENAELELSKNKNMPPKKE